MENFFFYDAIPYIKSERVFLATYSDSADRVLHSKRDNWTGGSVILFPSKNEKSLVAKKKKKKRRFTNLVSFVIRERILVVARKNLKEISGEEF